eukprot:2114456-Ditylum_brightwellii.AAC.1
MVEMRLKNSNKDLAVVVTNIKHCEEMKLAFKQMKLITKGTTGGVVREILVFNPIPLKSPALYDQVIANLDFEHAEPYTVLDDQDEEEMVKCIGELGTSEGAAEVLDGNFDPNQFDNLLAVNYWIKHNI